MLHGEEHPHVPVLVADYREEEKPLFDRGGASLAALV
jgi:hypothetical protein